MSDDDPSSAPRPARPDESGGAGADVIVDTPCPLWRDAVPGADDLCRTAATAALEAAGLGGLARRAELGVRLSDNAEVRALNARYRGRDAATNVLSFAATDCAPGRPPPVPADGAPLALGDVVIAYETVQAEAAAEGKPLAHHLSHLVVHGVLHLLGYEHDREPEAAVMEGLETAVLTRLGVPDPYGAEHGAPQRSPLRQHRHYRP